MCLEEKITVQNNRTVIENNRMIAEFMGYKVEENIFGGIPVNGMKTITSTSDTLKFHKDWNWLMPVVEKIESVGNYGFTIYRKSTNINGLPIESANTCKTSKIEATYNAVVNFIIWYNASH